VRKNRWLLERARKEFKGKRLGCWCKPLACHGDIWVELLEGKDEMADDSKKIFEVEKKHWLKVVVSVSKYQGSVYVDFREHNKPKDEDEFKFTKKGFTLPNTEAFDKFVDGLVEHRDEIKATLEEMGGPVAD